MIELFIKLKNVCQICINIQTKKLTPTIHKTIHNKFVKGLYNVQFICINN